MIEHASTEGRSSVTSVIARAPDHVRAAINRNRTARGLAAVPSARDLDRLAEARLLAEAANQAAETRGPGVWVEDRAGRLVPAYAGWRPARTSRSTTAAARASTTAPSRGPLVDRVLMLATYLDAPAANVRDRMPEAIAHNAFGSADELNRLKGWSLREGHHGPVLGFAGERLRAIDTPSGLVIAWEPDMALPWNRDALRSIEAGNNACSVSMKIASSRLARMPGPTTFVTEARLVHVAILGPDERPAYPGARAVVFRSAWRDDPDELRRQIDRVVECGRWHSRQARG